MFSLLTASTARRAALANARHRAPRPSPSAVPTPGAEFTGCWEGTLRDDRSGASLGFSLQLSSAPVGGLAGHLAFTRTPGMSPASVRVLEHSRAGLVALVDTAVGSLTLEVRRERNRLRGVFYARGGAGAKARMGQVIAERVVMAG